MTAAGSQTLPPRKGEELPPGEIEQLIALFNAGRHAELEGHTRSLLERYPNSGFAWKALGACLQRQGKAALPALQRATELLPDDAQAHKNLGLALQALGQCEGAVASYRRVLTIEPGDAEVHNNLGNALRELGQFDEAVASFRRGLALKPQFAEAHNNLGLALQDRGQFDEAVASFGRALALKPDFAEAHNNLGNTLRDLGRLDEAVASFRRALDIRPEFAEAHNNLGNTLRDLGRFDEAVASYRQALAIKPEYAGAHTNLGHALQSLGQFDAAVASYRRALDIRPDYAGAHNNLGNTLRDLGQLEEAVASIRRALAIKPDFAEAHNNLGNALRDLGRFDEAVASYRRALEIKPDFAEAHNNLGNALQDLGQLDAAIASCRRALAIKPDYAEAHNNLGSTLRELGQFNDAVTRFRQAIAIAPDFREAHSNLGNALRDLGRLDDAVASYRRALEIKPDFADAYSNLLFVYGYHALIDPHEYLVQSCAWEQACVPAQAREAAHRRKFERAPLAGRRLKLGYVSGDFRAHSVSYFVEQLFAQHDRTQIELFAYSTIGQRDAITERLQALAERWIPVVGVSDEALRDRIDADGIDVLVDLSGHTGHNRLGVFARRAAPVQAHYLGYVASTGLTEMDYWIGDDTLTPPETDSHFVERVWRLPRVWVSYAGKADAPVAAWRPSDDGTVWLGSFNNLGKLTPATLALWAKVLDALPEGKLLLKTKELRDSVNRQRILDAMSNHGVLSDRIELQDGSTTPGWSTHMAYYDRLDIVLDPVRSMGGSTSTCDALWMGVPVIAAEGDRMASRMTASMLNAIGHPEWIARSEAEYIDKVVSLARDVEKRKVLRSSQRSSMAAGPLCDASDLARSLEGAYHEMFQKWFDAKR